MDEGSRVIVTRPKWSGRDLLRAYRVEIDGVDHGKIKRGQKIGVDIAPGAHVAVARIDGNGSPPVEFVAEPGETVRLEVAPSGNAVQFWHAYTSMGYLRLTLLASAD